MSYISSIPIKREPTVHTGMYTHMAKKTKTIAVYTQTAWLESTLCVDVSGNPLSCHDTASSAAYLRECVMRALKGTDLTRYNYRD